MQAKSMMFSAKWDVVFRGTAAHAAGNPRTVATALLAGAQAVTALYALPRHGCLATHVNVGRFQGTARNVIADRAELEIELRGEAATALDHMERRPRWTLDGIAAAHGCELVVTEMGRRLGLKPAPAPRPSSARWLRRCLTSSGSMTTGRWAAVTMPRSLCAASRTRGASLPISSSAATSLPATTRLISISRKLISASAFG
jgi:metal-dependent amidase/aminoacylase/carboxypeptidase family protein